MTAHRTVEELEALLSGELAATELAAIESHVKDCPECQSELAWLRSERQLFARRSRAPMAPDLWSRIEAKLPPQPQTAIAPPRRKRSPQFGQWVAVAGTAAAMLVMLTFGGAGALGLRERLRSMFSSSPSGSSVKIEIHSGDSAEDHPKEEAERTASLPVTGPVTLRLATASADIDAFAGNSDAVRVWVSDSECKRVELQKQGSGEIRALFDSREGLKSGHLRVEVPRLSSLIIATASGAVHCADIGGDLCIDTASGDVQVSQVRKLTINTASGDVSGRGFTGPLQIRTVSGDIHLESPSGLLASLDINTVSGEVELDGVCAAGCRVGVSTVSGDVQFHTHQTSSFTLSMSTLTGELYQSRGKDKSANGEEPGDAPVQSVKIGSGEGSVGVHTQSGDVHLIEG